MSVGSTSDTLIGVGEFIVPKPTNEIMYPRHAQVTSVGYNTVTAGGKTYNISDVYKCSTSGTLISIVTGIRTGGGYRKSRRNRRGRKNKSQRRRHR
jgi:hypothetical protein